MLFRWLEKDILSKNLSDRKPSIVRPDKNCIFLKPLDSKKKPVIHFTGLFFLVEWFDFKLKTENRINTTKNRSFMLSYRKNSPLAHIISIVDPDTNLTNEMKINLN